ncbi:MAG: glycoside hydrolase family 25 protein [Erysipelotrichaceae bacterium]|nr:glycoside hydrolase family 25 protein [Erysipelotrichaceae bacterium]
MNKNKRPQIIIMIAILFGLLLIALIGLLLRPKKTEEPMIEDIPEEIIEVDYKKIEDRNGKYYYEDDHFSSSFGIDVSTFQNKIDWKKVKDEGVEFAYIRIGRRGATTGLLYPDDMFEENYKGARDNGIKVGIYFFSQAISEKEAIEEADYLLSLLGDKKIDFPIVYDCEEVYLDDETSRTSKTTKEQFTKNALAFIKRLEEKGYSCMIYTYQYWADNYYDMEQLKEYPLWYAQYDVKEPDFSYPVTIWQYSHSGTINGIEGSADLDIMFIRKDEAD